MCHAREPFKAEKMSFTQKTMAVGNLVKALAALAMGAAVLYFLLR